MNKINKIIKILFFAIFFLLHGYGANGADYEAIALPSDIETADPAVFINSLYNWGISIVGFLAFAQFVISGIIYMTSGVVDKKKEAMGRMTDAIIGLGIALGAYLFLNIINPSLLKLEAPSIEIPNYQVEGGPIRGVQIGQLVTYPTPNTASTCDEPSMNALKNRGYQCTAGGTTTGGTCWTCLQVTGAILLLGSNQYDAQTARSQISNAGISINNPNECPPGQTTGCTSLSGILKSTVDGVKAIKNSCNCDVMITGGTEAGHASGAYSHANGWKVDLRFNTQLDNYIYGKIGTPSAPITSSSIQKDTNYCGSDENTYRYEPDAAGGAHWDVVVGECI